MDAGVSTDYGVEYSNTIVWVLDECARPCRSVGAA